MRVQSDSLPGNVSRDQGPPGHQPFGSRACLQLSSTKLTILVHCSSMMTGNVSCPYVPPPEPFRAAVLLKSPSLLPLSRVFIHFGACSVRGDEGERNFVDYSKLNLHLFSFARLSNPRHESMFVCDFVQTPDLCDIVCRRTVK
jgi:hypothetical protein